MLGDLCGLLVRCVWNCCPSRQKYIRASLKYYACMPSATMSLMRVSPASRPLTSLASNTLKCLYSRITCTVMFLLYREGYRRIYGVLQEIISKCLSNPQSADIRGSYGTLDASVAFRSRAHGRARGGVNQCPPQLAGVPVQRDCEPHQQAQIRGEGA